MHLVLKNVNAILPQTWQDAIDDHCQGQTQITDSVEQVLQFGFGLRDSSPPADPFHVRLRSV